MIATQWKSYCQNCDDDVLTISIKEPEHCHKCGEEYPLTNHRDFGQFTNTVKDLLDVPQGNGFKKLSDCLTKFHEIGNEWSFEILEGKKIVLITSSVLANLKLQNVSPIVFEAERYLTRAAMDSMGIPEAMSEGWYTIDQCWYENLVGVAGEADSRPFTSTSDGTILDAQFFWAQFDNVSRKPAILGNSGLRDRVRVYLTSEDRHSSENEYITGLPFFNKYTVRSTTAPAGEELTWFPSWPTPQPDFAAARFCFHATSYDIDQVLPSE